MKHSARLARWIPALAVVALPAAALAQGFPEPLRWSGERIVPAAIDSNEEMWNPWGRTVVGTTGEQHEYAPEISQRRWFLGSKLIINLGLDFARMDLAVDARGQDTLSLGWGATTVTTTRTGTSTATLRAPALVGGIVNAQSNGFWMTFQTTLATPRTIAADGTPRGLGSSGLGYHVNRLRAECCSSASALTSIRTIGLYERVTGLLMRTEDHFTMRTPATSGRLTIPVWLTPRAGVNGSIQAYVRCGAAPTPTAWDALWNVRDTGGGIQFIELPACTGNVFITWRNTSSQDRVFDFYVGGRTTHGDREKFEVKVGIGWNATESELRAIRHALSRAAWNLYGLSGGSQLVRTFRVLNNAHHCDDGWPLDEYACEGGGCQICLTPQDGTSNYNGLGKITMYRNSHTSSDVYTHEMGHWLLDLRDEYANNTGTRCGEVDLSICSYSMMSNYYNNLQNICTAHNHMHLPQDLRVTPESLVLDTPGCAFGCGGERECCDEPGRCDSRSAWQRLQDAGRVLVGHPSRTADNHDYTIRFALGTGPSLRTDGLDYWNQASPFPTGRAALGSFTRLR